MRDARGRVPNHRGDGQFRTAEVASDGREGAAQHEWRDTLKPCHGADAVERAPHIVAELEDAWQPAGRRAGFAFITVDTMWTSRRKCERPPRGGLLITL